MGIYEGNGVRITVSIADDHLTAQATGGTINEIYPLGNNMFLNKERNIRVEFVKDAEGRVIEHIVHRTKSREFHYKKTG